MLRVRRLSRILLLRHIVRYFLSNAKQGLSAAVERTTEPDVEECQVAKSVGLRSLVSADQVSVLYLT